MHIHLNIYHILQTLRNHRRIPIRKGLCIVSCFVIWFDKIVYIKGIRPLQTYFLRAKLSESILHHHKKINCALSMESTSIYFSSLIQQTAYIRPTRSCLVRGMYDRLHYSLTLRQSLHKPQQILNHHRIFTLITFPLTSSLAGVPGRSL